MSTAAPAIPDEPTSITGALNYGFFPKPPTFSTKLAERDWIKFRLAQAFRIFGHLGYDEGIAGHITARDPVKPDCFWVNPFGMHFSLVQASDLLLVSHHGDILEESGPMKLLNTAAFMIHSAIHTARPDVLCAAHSHTIYGKAFSAQGRELDMINQDSCAFYQDHVLLEDYKGVVLDEEEGVRIATTLGPKMAIILQNHGLLVATPSIEATIYFFTSLEKTCQVQLLADAAAGGRGGETVKIVHEEALKTKKVAGTARVGWFSGLPAFQQLEAREGVKYQFEEAK